MTQRVLQRIRLRWLVSVISLSLALTFGLVAMFDRQATALALACAVFFALKGLGWLIVLRFNRARLRRHGFRW